MEDPEVEQRHRAGPRPHLLPGVRRAPRAYHFVEKALAELHAGRTKTWNEFTVPEEAIACGFHEAVRGVLSHHVVIRNGKIANYHPYPPTPWNGSVRDIYGTPGPYEDAVQNTPIFEENGPDNFKGIDIMRAVRSFDPCLPVRRPHVPGQRQGAGDPPFAVLRPLRRRPRAEPASEGVMPRQTEFERRIAADRRAGAATRDRGRPRGPGRGAGAGAARSWSCTARRWSGCWSRSAGTAAAGATIVDQLTRDELVASVLLLYDLHPVDLETRVRGALEKTRPYLKSHGGNVELVGIDETGVVRLRMQGSCHGCPSSAVTLKLAIEQAIHEAAPDVSAILVEGRTDSRPSRPRPR